MKTLVLITYVDFWRKGSGHRTRISSLVTWLKDKAKITVFFAGHGNDSDNALINEMFPDITVEFASTGTELTFRDYKEKFRIFVQDRFFDFALIEYIELSVVLEYLPANTVTILDTHDIISDKIRSFRRLNAMYDGIMLSRKEELTIYQFYDYIILIHKSDFENISKKINPGRLLLAPHPGTLKKKSIRVNASDIGYVASQYQPNIDALNWFINNVWEEIYKKHRLTLNIYGNIKHSFFCSPEMKKMNIMFHGFVDDLEKLYDSLDIVINPVRFGAGLKIKNVEALTHGIPLITTSHGASGIDDGAAKAFLVGNTPSEYLLAVDKLVENYEFRKELAENAFKYAQLNFSEEKCYTGLLKVIK